MRDRCKCGAVLGIWDDPNEHPFVEQGMMHSPLGCIRGVRSFDELRNLYRLTVGFDYHGDSKTALYQALVSALAQRDPDFVKSIVNVVLREVPTLPARAYTPEVVKPRRNTGSRGGSGVGGVPVIPTPPPWVAGTPKPPWIKE